MRGDSIRDRYAKGLALLGLGMLAGAGAVVDYWPAPGSLPLVPPVERGALAAAALPAPVDPFAILVPAPVPAAPRRQPPTVPAALPVLDVSRAPLVVGEPIAMAPPPLPIPAPVPAASPVTMLASADRVLGGSAGGGLILPAAASPRHGGTWDGAEEDDSFLTGTVKRTGASILRTSARAGVSVFDAVKSLGDAMRRALPN